MIAFHAKLPLYIISQLLRVFAQCMPLALKTKKKNWKGTETAFRTPSDTVSQRNRQTSEIPLQKRRIAIIYLFIYYFVDITSKIGMRTTIFNCSFYVNQTLTYGQPLSELEDVCFSMESYKCKEKSNNSWFEKASVCFLY